MSSPQNTPCFVQKMCIHIPRPREIPANLRRPRPRVWQGEVVAPFVAKRGIKHMEQSLPHALKRVGIVIVEGLCHGIDDVLQISALLDLRCTNLQGVEKAKVQDVKVWTLCWLPLQRYVVSMLGAFCLD